MVRNKSFTLIELLVVIAIIGLLASIVLVSMGGIQSKARITKTLEFSQSIQHALGAYAVGWWSFDEGSGTIASDGSGYGNNGIINEAVYTDDTPHKAAGRGQGKYALSFDGVNDYVDIGDVEILNITNTVTVEAWFKIYETGSGWHATIIDTICTNQCSGGPYFLGFVGNTINFMTMGSSGGWHSGASYAISPNTWYHVVGTYDTSISTKKLYINGSLVTTVTGLTGPLRSMVNGTKIWIGNGYAEYFNGLIDEVRVYEKALTLGEIQKHYAEGLEKHHDLAVK